MPDGPTIPGARPAHLRRPGLVPDVQPITLVEFLRARLDEEQQSVEQWDSDGRAQVAVMWTGPEPGYTTVAMAHPGTPWIADGREVADARHVRVLYDPARVLADIEAKRRLVDLHVDGGPGGCYCLECGDITVAWPCPTLRLLALPHAGHTDYRAEEWSPDPARE